MSIIFNAEDHSYKSIDSDENINWISVTTLISKFKNPFNAEKVANKVSKKKNSKWYGIEPKKIQEIWNNESIRAMTLGTFYHDQREADMIEFDNIKRYGSTLPIFRAEFNEEGAKIALDQKLVSGIYPELLVYLKSAGLCGQADLVEIVNGYINITDYKTNKEIKEKGFTNWEGITSKMYKPLSHLDDCNLNHYNIQLSIYMYIILKHNPKLKPGKLIIQHVSFEKEGENAHGYPITKYDGQGEPIIKEIKIHDLPYMKEEVRSLIMWLKNKN